MQETEHYKLKKPSAEDFYNIADQNGNMDKVDAALHELEEGKADLDLITGKVRGDQLPDMAFVPTSRKVNGKALSADITLTAGDVGARSSSWTPTWSEVQSKPATFTPSAHTHAPADLTSPVPISLGGTGATTAAEAVAALGVATREEAEAGEDDSKIMTPAKVKTAIGTAKETVLDKRINKLVRVRSRLKVVGESPLSFGFLQLMENNSNVPFCVNLDSKKFFALGRTNDQKYVCASNMTQSSNLANYHRDYVARESSYPIQNFDNIPCYSEDGSLIAVVSNRYSAVDRFLVDTQSPRVSASVYNPIFAYRNATVWGYCNRSGSSAIFQYGTISEGGNPGASYKSFALGSSSYSLIGVGVYDNKIFFVEQAGDTLWQLGTFDLVTYTFSRGLLNFSNANWSGLTLKSIFQDPQYGYLGVYRGNPTYASCTTYLKIDMSNVSSNWDNLPAPVTSAYDPIGNGGVYIGTIDEYAYSAYGNWLVKADKASGLLSYTGLTSEVSIVLSYLQASMRERVVSLPGYENLIPVFNAFIDVSQSTIIPLYYKSEIAQSGTTAELYFMPSKNLAFTGTLVDDPRTICVGTISSTLTNGRYWATAAGANPEFSLFYKAGDVE